MSQSKTAFDFFFVVQTVNSRPEDVKSLNRRIQWQLDHFNRELKFVRLDIVILRLLIFIDAFFANNKNYTSQIEFVIVLADDENKINLIH